MKSSLKACASSNLETLLKKDPQLSECFMLHRWVVPDLKTSTLALSTLNKKRVCLLLAIRKDAETASISMSEHKLSCSLEMKLNTFFF